MPLLLPKSVTGVVEGQIRGTSKAGLSHTLSEFTNEKVSVSDLVKLLGTIKRSEAIRLIANMAASVSRDDGMSLPFQMAMAQGILPEDVWVQVSRKIPRNPQHPGRLFHRRQIWFLLQMAILSCPEDAPDADNLTLQKQLGLAALMASDVMSQVERTHMPDAGTNDTDEWAATALMSLIDHRPGNEVICRAICFWLDMENDDVVKRSMRDNGFTSTLSDAFRAKYGVGLYELLFVLVNAYQVYWVDTQQDPPVIHLLEPSVMKGMPYSEADVAGSIALAGTSIDNLAPALLAPRQSWATDFSPLRGKPLLEVFDGKFTCADTAVFTMFFMDGIYDLLEDTLPKEKFRSLFGVMFERYVNRLFNEFLYSGSLLERTFAPSPKFVGTKDQAADGIIFASGVTMIMEYKGGMLTPQQKYGTEISETVKGLNGLLARMDGRKKKGVGQLVDNIKRILSGEKLHVGNDEISIPSDSIIMPALVVYDDNLGLHAIRNMMQARFDSVAKDAGLSSDRFGPLVVLTTRDVESLQEFASVADVKTIFSRYQEHLLKNPGDLAGSFHGFMYHAFAGTRPSKSFVQKRVVAYYEELLPKMEACVKPEDE